jgi:hypothetical protein
MARSAKSDPIRNFKFQVTINADGALGNLTQGLSRIGFAAMSGLSVQNEMVGYREGGMNTHPHKFIGQLDQQARTTITAAISSSRYTTTRSRLVRITAQDRWKVTTFSSVMPDSDLSCSTAGQELTHLAILTLATAALSCSS